MNIRHISSSWNFLVSRNWLSSGVMDIGVYVAPSSRTATFAALELPENPWFHDSLIFEGSFTVPGIESIPDGVAEFLKKVLPYSSVAIESPIEFLAMAMGEYPTSPSKPSPGIWRTSSGLSLTIPPGIVGASDSIIWYS